MILRQFTYNARKYKCQEYEQSDLHDMLVIADAWRQYADSVQAIAGTHPQISPAFTQAYCCLKLGLVRNIGPGVDAFELDPSGAVIKRIEIKATSTINGRNDVKLYDGSVSLGRHPRQSKAGSLIRSPNFDELYWLAFHGSRRDKYDLYKILPQHIFTYDDKHLPAIRGGRINVHFSELTTLFSLTPIISATL